MVSWVAASALLAHSRSTKRPTPCRQRPGVANTRSGTNRHQHRRQRKIYTGHSKKSITAALARLATLYCSFTKCAVLKFSREYNAQLTNPVGISTSTKMVPSLRTKFELRAVSSAPSGISSKYLKTGIIIIALKSLLQDYRQALSI